MTSQNQKLEDIQQLVTRLIEAWNAHDVDRVAAFYAANFKGVDVGESESQAGPQSIRASMARYLSAFPDLHFTSEQTVVQANCAAIAWLARATHRGTLMNIPPTGRAIAVRGMSFITSADGLIIRAQNIWDMAGLLRAIGLLPEL